MSRKASKERKENCSMLANQYSSSPTVCQQLHIMQGKGKQECLKIFRRGERKSMHPSTKNISTSRVRETQVSVDQRRPAARSVKTSLILFANPRRNASASQSAKTSSMCMQSVTIMPPIHPMNLPTLDAREGCVIPGQDPK